MIKTTIGVLIIAVSGLIGMLLDNYGSIDGKGPLFWLIGALGGGIGGALIKSDDTF